MVTLPNSQSGVVHTLPLLVIIAAVGIISFLLITATLPIGGLFGILNPKPSSQAATEGFIETFAYGGLPGTTAPIPFTHDIAKRWVIFPANNDGLISRIDNGLVGGNVDITAGHGPMCQAPMGNADPTLNNHVIPHTTSGRNSSLADIINERKNILPNYLYVCNNHMMSVAFSGTTEQSFMARYMMDWSSGRTVTFQFDVNPYSPGRAGWWDIYIARPDEFIVSTANFSKDAIVIDATDGIVGLELIHNYLPVMFDPGDTEGGNRHRFGGVYCSDNPTDPACDDPRIRRTFKFTINETSFSYAVVKPDGTLWGPFTENWPCYNDYTKNCPIPFTQGTFKIGHWTYNPTKEGLFHQNIDPSTATPENPPGYSRWVKGDPFSITTFHWANYKFNGPAIPWKTGYLMDNNTFIDTTGFNGRGSNPSSIAHVNITSSDLRNPSVWGELVEGGLVSEMNRSTGDYAFTAVRSDPKSATHWAQVSVNGGPWLDIQSVRDYSPDTFVPLQCHATSEAEARANCNNPDNDPGVTSMTFRVPLPISGPGSIHQGDNTLQFRANTPNPASYAPAGQTPRQVINRGFTISYAEIQVDPNEDLPPANPGGSSGCEGEPGTCTPGPSGILPTPPPPTPPAASPTPPATPPPGSMTINFNDRAHLVLINGEYPSGVINWGTNNWVGSNPYSVFTTNSFSFNGGSLNSAIFSLVSQRRVVSIQAANGGTIASMVTIGCPGNPTISQNVPLNQLTTITTNWTASCTGPVTLTSTNGQNTNFDNLVLSATSVTPPPSPAPTPTPNCPLGPLGDIDCDGDIDIFDFNTLISNFGQIGTNLLGDLDKDGDIDIFDFNSLIGNFGT